MTVSLITQGIKAVMTGDVKPRIAGVVYDWDLWPLRVAAGVGPVSFEVERLSRDIDQFVRAFGLTFAEAVRAFDLR